MTIKNGLSAVAVTVALVLAGCGSRENTEATADTQAAPPAAAPTLPANITINTPGLLPEGVEFDTKNNRFLVGSLSQGTIHVVGQDGTLTPFVQDSELKSSVGIEVDEERNRLLVANSDAAVFQGQGPGQAKLGIYNLDTGERIAMIDLAAVGPEGAQAHFANDIAVASDGSVYVTNSFARVIYKVDANNTASVFLPNSFRSAQQHMFNGIEAHPSGYLLVAESAAGELYKVPLDNPAAFTKVTLPEPVNGADGIVLGQNGNLFVVRNDQSNSVVELTSADDWMSAQIAARGTFGVQATTAALADNAVYVVHPHFNDPNAAPFIERVEMQAAAQQAAQAAQ